jgi:hypothetical protein
MALSKTSLLTDKPTLRKCARQHIDEGSVTAGFSAGRAIVLNLPNTRRMLESILAMEEEHADDLANLLVALPAEPAEKARPPNSK